MKVKDLGNLYVYRHCGVVFAGKSGIIAPQREDDDIDEYDSVFVSREEYERWFKDLQIDLAKLDEPMNYCEYFQRTKGNDGNYVREGRSFLVNGLWDGQHLNCLHVTPKGFVCCSMKEFSAWLDQNSFKKDWWKLRQSYVDWQKTYIPVMYRLNETQEALFSPSI